MKRFIKLIASAVVIGSMLLCGCGEKQVEAEAEVEAPKILHIYSYDENIAAKLEYVWERHSDWKERVEVIVLPKEGYASAIDSLLTADQVEKYPDLILGDYEDVAHFVGSDEIVPVSELGFDESDTADMYEYTKSFVSDGDGNLKGVTWEARPGAFVYRRSLAAEYLGSDDEKNVQSYVKDWDTFIDTARALNKKTDGGVKMLASARDIEKVYSGGCWMIGEEAAINSGMDKMLDVQYALVKNQFVVNADAEASSYLKAINLGNVFGYFADSEVLSLMEQNCTGESKTDWAVCRGPQGYINGGVWAFASKDCCDKEMAGNILKALCTDEAVLKKISEEGSFINSKRVMSNAFNSGKGKISLLGGGDYIKVFNKVAEEYQIENRSEYDSLFEAEYMALSIEYCKGSKTKEQIADEYAQKADAILNPVVEEPEEVQE